MWPFLCVPSVTAQQYMWLYCPLHCQCCFLSFSSTTLKYKMFMVKYKGYWGKLHCRAFFLAYVLMDPKVRIQRACLSCRCDHELGDLQTKLLSADGEQKAGSSLPGLSTPILPTGELLAQTFSATCWLWGDQSGALGRALVTTAL